MAHLQSLLIKKTQCCFWVKKLTVIGFTVNLAIIVLKIKNDPGNVEKPQVVTKKNKAGPCAPFPL